MFREANELSHRPQILIEVVELISARAGTRSEAGESVQRAIDSAVIGEIHQIHRRARWNHVRQRMLVRVNMRRGRNGDASIDVGKIDKRRIRARGIMELMEQL